MYKRLMTVAIALLLLLPSCRPKDEIVTVSAVLMDTYVRIHVYNPGKRDEAVLQDVVLEMEGLSRLLSRHERGDIWRINNAEAGEKVLVSPDTTAVLLLAKEYYELSGGYFDVTIGAVSALWDFTGGNEPPQPEVINAALSSVGMLGLEIGSNYVVKHNSNTELDLGGIAKGYIADRAHDRLKYGGVNAAVIDAGGDIRLLGERPGKGSWTVGIQDAFGFSDYAGILSLPGGAVATSGTYQRSFTHSGILYHHLLDPYTGRPRDSGLVSVTAIAENAARADALAGTLFLLGEEAGTRLVERLNTESGGVGAVFIRENGEISHVGDAILNTQK